jgi:hypothetical protein
VFTQGRAVALVAPLSAPAAGPCWPPDVRWLQPAAPPRAAQRGFIKSGCDKPGGRLAPRHHRAHRTAPGPEKTTRSHVPECQGDAAEDRCRSPEPAVRREWAAALCFLCGPSCFAIINNSQRKKRTESPAPTSGCACFFLDSAEGGEQSSSLLFWFWVCKWCQRVRHQWLTPVILAAQEAEIRRITVQRQPWQIVHETLSQKDPTQKKTGGVAQGVGPENPVPKKKKKKKKKKNKRIKRGPWVGGGCETVV